MKPNHRKAVSLAAALAAGAAMAAGVPPAPNGIELPADNIKEMAHA